jgi:hypothetical protein
MRLRYLCFDIFLRRFLMSDPMKKPLGKGEDRLPWSRFGETRSNQTLMGEDAPHAPSLRHGRVAQLWP